MLGITILPLYGEKQPCSGLGAGPSKVNSARPSSFIFLAFNTMSPAYFTSGSPRWKKVQYVSLISIFYDFDTFKITEHTQRPNEIRLLTLYHGSKYNSIIFLQYFRRVPLWSGNELCFSAIYIFLHPRNSLASE